MIQQWKATLFANPAACQLSIRRSFPAKGVLTISMGLHSYLDGTVPLTGHPLPRQDSSHLVAACHSSEEYPKICHAQKNINPKK